MLLISRPAGVLANHNSFLYAFFGV